MPKILPWFSLAFLLLLWQTRPLGLLFQSDLPRGMYTLLKSLVLSTTAWLKTLSLQVCCLGLPKYHFLTSLCTPGQGRILQIFHYFFCLFLTITAETLRPMRVAEMSYLQCFLYCLPHKRTHLSKCWVTD